jgi:membrane protease YdiL (CAAX protease family)
MTFEPLTKGLLVATCLGTILLLNILGEEFLWRGLMLTRQEVVFGKYTWLVHDWLGIFHIAFGGNC